MKVLPDLEFEEDESVETADRIEQLLQQVRPPDEESR
jgi:ribosome-binding factor A